MLKALLVANNEARLRDGEDWARHIEEFHGLVVRMSRCRQLGGLAGRRTDMVYVVAATNFKEAYTDTVVSILKEDCPEFYYVPLGNAALSLEDWVAAKWPLDSPVFPMHDGTMALTEMFLSLASPTALPLEFVRRDEPCPSTGMFTAVDLLIKGFEIWSLGFDHNGWPGHCWHAEAAFFTKLAEWGLYHRLEEQVYGS